uniref:Oxidation resistance protein 1 n=1 Tax=Trichobilharzia regenti TaxID=157069 RepID=A0AA85JN38_TRIRE|nr:unnamed protein product [Trichobilharzia regenti]
MSFRENTNLSSAQAFLCRSKSLYDGTKSTMRLSNLTSKIKTVSSTLANTNPFGGKSQDKSIAEETLNDAKQRDGSKKIRRRTCKRITSTTESSTSAGVSQEKPERKKRKRKTKEKQSEVMNKPEKKQNILQTMEYVVQEGDSFNSVAARFDVTPSELCRINRFLSRTLFVGQMIKVPVIQEAVKTTEDPCVAPCEEKTLTESSNPDEKSEKSAVTMTGNKTTTTDSLCNVTEGNMESKRLSQKDSLTSSFSETDTDEWEVDESSYSEYTDYADEENDPMACQYLKFDCKFVVDLQCSIPGIILVTTDMFVFKPNDEEQYPLENHCKQIPLNQFRTVAVYRDPSVMYFTKRGAQTSSSTIPVKQENDSTKSVEIKDGNQCLINNTKEVMTSSCSEVKEDVSLTSSTEKDKENIEEKNTGTVITNETQNTSSQPVQDKCDLDENPLYLCVLVSPYSMRSNKHRRHPHWFTIQSEEYWFLIPQGKAQILFDFLLTCQFHGYEDDSNTEEHFTDIESSQVSIKSIDSKNKDNMKNRDIETLHSKSLGNLSFLKKSLNSPKSTGSPCSGDVESDNFNDRSRALMTLRNDKQKRVQSSKDFSVTVTDNGNSTERSAITEDSKESNKAQQSPHRASLKVTTSSHERIRECRSVPSMEEEKSALRILKEESIDWEWLKSSFRSVRENLNKLLVSSKEMELKEQEERRRAFMSDCIKLAEPESLPLPPATSNSEILDAQKVRNLLQNLIADAEGLDWVLTYSTSLHGFSLRSLYRRCANSLTEASEDDLHNSIHSKMKHTRAPSSPHASNQPCIITIRTSNNEIFGAMLNTHPYPSGGRFYGNGSTFVFRWINSDQEGKTLDRADSLTVPVNQDNETNQKDVNSISASSPRDLGCDVHSSFGIQTETVTDELAHLFFLDSTDALDSANQQIFQKFVWSGKNSYFINGGYDSLTIGCSEGHSAIHLDDVLLHGRSESCETFDNPQLTSSPDFVITTLEIWSFI